MATAEECPGHRQPSSHHVQGVSSPFGQPLTPIIYPMPTAVPATVPPSGLCTKFVPPIVFAKEVLGTISILSVVISMRPVLCLPQHIPKNKKYRAERPQFFVEFSIICSSFGRVSSVFLLNLCPGCDFGGPFGYFGCLGPHLDPKRAQ